MKKTKFQGFNKSGFITILGMLLIAVFLSVFTLINTNRWGRILFTISSWTDERWIQNLYMMDGDGNRIQLISSVIDGPPSWSIDGKLIAIASFNKVNIIDSEKVINYREYPLPFDKNLMIINESTMYMDSLPLPDECLINGYEAYDRILSVSWSRDSKKLAIVCGNMSSSVVCILSLTDKTTCWSNDILKFPIQSVTWSPITDTLAVSGGKWREPSIYLVNPDGTNPTYITDGWGPEYSPNGRKLVYFKWDATDTSDINISENPNESKQSGISIMNLDGTEEKWVYKPLSSANNVGEIIYSVRPENLSKLTWSPTGRYIAFSALTGSGYDEQIYRLDLWTGKIVFLTYHVTNYNSNPDWGR
jgi:Tol biopolymer transport system component